MYVVAAMHRMQVHVAAACLDFKNNMVLCERRELNTMDIGEMMCRVRGGKKQGVTKREAPLHVVFDGDNAENL